MPKQIHRNYCCDVLTLAPERPQCFLKETWIQVAEVRIAVHENGCGPGVYDGVRRRGERHGGNNYHVLWPGA
jgi:hypothetical protein